MTEKKSYLVSDLAAELGVPRTTLNDWLKRFDRYLASEMTGRRRAYTEDALKVLREVNRMRNDGMAVSRIESELEKSFAIRPEEVCEEQKEEKAPQILCDSAYPLTNNGTIPAETESKEEKLPSAQAIFLRMPGTEDPRFRHLQLVLQMFPGNTPLKVRMLDTGKLLGTKCLLHPSLIRELKEVFGEENVVVK